MLDGVHAGGDRRAGAWAPMTVRDHRAAARVRLLDDESQLVVRELGPQELGAPGGDSSGHEDLDEIHAGGLEVPYCLSCFLRRVHDPRGR